GLDAKYRKQPHAKQEWAAARRDVLAVVFALAAFDRHDVGPLHADSKRRQRLDRLFAPLGDGALMGEADAKPEQLADVGRRRRAFGKTLIEEALISRKTVAVMFQ